MKSAVEKNSIEPVKEVVTAPARELTELEKITGVYIIKNARKTWLSTMSGNKDGRDIHSGTFVLLTPERDPISGLINTGLNGNKRLQAELEEEMNLPANTLSPYNIDWWAKYFIKIPSESLVLNCNTAKNKLTYILLKANSKVANSTAELASKPDAEFVITSVETDKAKESKALEVKTKAYAKLSSMSIEERMNFLKVYEEGRFKVKNNSKPDFVNAAIGQIVESKPAEFLQVFENPFYQESIFLQDCLAIKAVQKQGQKYYITGGEKIGDSYLNTLANLSSDDWQEAKISLIGKLEAAK